MGKIAKFSWRIVALIIVLGIITAALGFLHYRALFSPEVLTTLGSIPLYRYNGSAVYITEFIGKPLVINLWASWCPYCKQELIELSKAQKEFSPENLNLGQVIIIAVNRGESLATSKKFTDELKITDDLLFLLDPEELFYANISSFAMPETIFVNREGLIVYRHRGPLDFKTILENIRKII